MNDIVNALMRSIDIVESKIDFNNQKNNDQDMIELHNLLGKAITSVYTRIKLEKRMREYDVNKDRKLFNAIWDDPSLMQAKPNRVCEDLTRILHAG
jgi:hypothetical protein